MVITLRCIPMVTSILKVIKHQDNCFFDSFKMGLNVLKRPKVLLNRC